MTIRQRGRVVYELTSTRAQLEFTICLETTRPSCLIVLVYTPNQNTNCKGNWKKNLTKYQSSNNFNLAIFAWDVLFTFCNLTDTTESMHLVSIKQHHKTHLITDIFVKKITKEVFIGIGVRYKNRRGHEMSKNLNTGLIINTEAIWLLEILLHFPLRMGLK